MENQNPSPAFRIASVSVQAMKLTAGVGVDQVTEVTYTDGRFLSSTRVVTGPVGPQHELTGAELTALLASLRAASPHVGPTVDATVLTTFIHLVALAVLSEPSGRFDHARFGAIVKDTSGAIVGHLGLGVDVVGTVHDAQGAITYEQHPVPFRPGPFQPLSTADRASLSAALKSYVTSTQNADPLWSTLLSDLDKPTNTAKT